MRLLFIVAFFSLSFISQAFSQADSSLSTPTQELPAQTDSLPSTKKHPAPKHTKKEITPPPQTKKEPHQEVTSPSQVEKEPNPEATSAPHTALQTYFDNSAQENNSSSQVALPSPTANLPSAWGPFFFLLVLILLTYFIIRWVKNRVQRLKTASNPIDFIRTIGTIPLNAHAQLVLVDIGGKYYLLTVSSHSSEILMEVTDPDLILKIQSIPPSGLPRKFSEIFLDLLGIRGGKKISPVKSEEKLKKFIEVQKDRIGKM